MENKNTAAEGHLITAVAPGSIAEQLGICPGDRLLSVNGKPVEDVFDYRFRISSESVVMNVLKKDGEEWELDIENGYEDPGLTFASGLMSDYRSCSNQCVFCFIDQMPPGMRDTLYFKDDDSRLSFLQGNYVTLTNMKEKDIRHIIEYRLEPINISVHTTNGALRCRMLNNRFAGESLHYIQELYDAGIHMNGQIVLCRGLNDGAELRKTLRDLLAYAPLMESVSVVPVGLSKYREGLTALQPIEQADAADAVNAVEEVQKLAMERLQIHFAHASDELYLLAGLDIPEEKRYDGYLQLENGVGMMRLLEEEVKDALTDVKPSGNTETVSIATGLLAAPFLQEQLRAVGERLPAKKIQLHAVKNRFFGERITVAGLLTGQDIIRELSGKELGNRLLLPQCMFRSGEEVLLDDVTRQEIEDRLGVKTVIVGSSGYDLVNAVNDTDYSSDTVYPGYENKT